MSPNHKLLSHPDKEEVVSQLLNGATVREVADFLKQKYPEPNNAHLRVSFSTIQQFKRQYLDVDRKVVLDLRASARAEETARVDGETRAELQSTSAYQNKLNEIVDSKLDVQRELIKIFSVLESRIEHFYNLLQTHQFPNSREERVFQGYIDQLIKLLDSYKKYVEGYNDSIEHNININVVNNQIDLVRDSVRAALEEVSPELSIKFMGILSRNMRALEGSQEGTIIAETVSHVKH